MFFNRYYIKQKCRVLSWSVMHIRSTGRRYRSFSISCARAFSAYYYYYYYNNILFFCVLFCTVSWFCLHDKSARRARRTFYHYYLYLLFFFFFSPVFLVVATIRSAFLSAEKCRLTTYDMHRGATVLLLFDFPTRRAPANFPFPIKSAKGQCINDWSYLIQNTPNDRTTLHCPTPYPTPPGAAPVPNKATLRFRLERERERQRALYRGLVQFIYLLTHSLTHIYIHSFIHSFTINSYCSLLSTASASTSQRAVIKTTRLSSGPGLYVYIFIAICICICLRLWLCLWDWLQLSSWHAPSHATPCSSRIYGRWLRLTKLSKLSSSVPRSTFLFLLLCLFLSTFTPIIIFVLPAVAWELLGIINGKLLHVLWRCRA